MQRSIGAFIGSALVAIAVIVAGLILAGRKKGVTGSGDAAVIIEATVQALVSADTGNKIPSYAQLVDAEGYNRAGSLYQKSAMGLKQGATTFAGLVANPNVIVSSAAKAGVRIFTEISAFDREAYERLGMVANGLSPRDAHLAWFFDMERVRAETWNRVGAEVTKPLADAAVLDPNAMTPKLRLTKHQLERVRLTFANAAAELGGTETTPARLVDDFHWRLFGVGLFAERPRGAAAVRDAVSAAEGG